LPVIPDHTFKLTDFGAVGDGQTLNTEAFRKAIAAVAQAGGGTLVISQGIFCTLPFSLCSNLDLHLEAGAVIQAPATFAAFGIPDPATLHSQDEVKAQVTTPAPLITGDNLHDLAITGTGAIDGSGAHWWEWAERPARLHPGRVMYTRPNMVVITGCQRLHVADVTFRNSSRYNLVARDITDLVVERVKTREPFNSPNTDGIDIGPGNNFLVRDCDCDDGDDDICIKSGGTNILIENCTVHHGHGISIGSGTTVGVHNMLVRHCTFDGADFAIRIKSMRGAGGPVSNVRYTDIQMKNVANAIMLYSDYVDGNRPNFKGDPKLVPNFHDVLIDHITVESARSAGRIVGLPERPITEIGLRHITINASNPFEIKDAGQLAFDDVIVNIEPGLVPKP
jgi:polygalacturonase